MKVPLFILVALSFQFIYAATNDFDSDIRLCNNIDVENTLCRLNVDGVRPTQFLFSPLAARKKTKKFSKAYNEGDLHELLSSKILPAVIGPDQQFYILDGHHTSYGLKKSAIPKNKKQLFLRIQKNCVTCSFEGFERYMTETGKARSFLYDINYEKRRFFELPSSIEMLIDDPYRSLSWLVRKESCYKKVQRNYLEFTWAKVIRDEFTALGIILSESKKKKLKKLVGKACLIVKKEKYSHLPGYNPEPYVEEVQ